MLRRIFRQGVARSDVLWCYQTLLNRPPESERVVRQHMAVASLRQLVEVFLQSEEYQSRRGRGNQHTLLLPETRIDTDATDDQLRAIAAAVGATWTALGQERPHHSVITVEAYRPGASPEALEAFWASGEIEAELVAKLLQRHGADPSRLELLEFGCGVGRVTAGLARRVRQVTALDISPVHQALAAERLTQLGRDNVSFLLIDEDGHRRIPTCDAVYSRLVLQHNPPPLMNAVLAGLLEALRPGGIAIVQLPTHRSGYRFALDEWLHAAPPADMEMHCLPMGRALATIRDSGCELLDVREDDSTGDARFISNVFVARRPTGN